MNSSDVQSMYDLIDYLFDKMNVRIEMTEEQVVNFVSKFSTKVVIWTIVSNAFKLAIALAVVIAVTIIVKKIMKKFNVKDAIKIGFKDEASSKQLQKAMCYCFAICVVALFQIIMISRIVVFTSQIVQSLLFPEKIVLEFVSKYL